MCEAYEILEEREDNPDYFINIHKFKSSCELELEYLSYIPGNDKRKFRIERKLHETSDFPEWSWYWTITEKEENKMQRENLEAIKKEYNG